MLTADVLGEPEWFSCPWLWAQLVKRGWLFIDAARDDDPASLILWDAVWLSSGPSEFIPRASAWARNVLPGRTSAGVASGETIPLKDELRNWFYIIRLWVRDAQSCSELTLMSCNCRSLHCWGRSAAVRRSRIVLWAVFHRWRRTRTLKMMRNWSW